MTGLSGILVHFGATQRTQGVKLHIENGDETERDRVAHRGTSKTKADPLYNSFIPHARTETICQVHLAQTPSATANTKIEIKSQKNKRTKKPKGSLLSICQTEKSSHHCFTERSVNTQSCHTPGQTQVCAESY